MKIQVIRKKDLSINKWSGGTTTQISIYPEKSQYKDLDFLWRISSAKVEAEKSEFTSLPGVNRILLVLDGEMKLVHKNHHSKEMKKYDMDFFSGSWETTSYGKVTDFNIMTREGCSADTEIINIDKEKDKVSLIKGSNILYCCKGEFQVELNGRSMDISDGDTLVVEIQDEECNAVVKTHTSATCVFTKIEYN